MPSCFNRILQLRYNSHIVAPPSGGGGVRSPLTLDDGRRVESEAVKGGKHGVYGLITRGRVLSGAYVLLEMVDLIWWLTRGVCRNVLSWPET